MAPLPSYGNSYSDRELRFLINSSIRIQRIQGYRDTGIQGYRNTGDTRIQGYMDTGIKGYRDTGIHDKGYTMYRIQDTGIQG